ncbi:MAG TPA: ABC transporter permease [Spirochaetia bacterium]|nr:ABC transporter permease [Spirochaetia bacterium]
MRLKFPNESGIIVVLIVIGVGLSLTSPVFFTISNIFTLLLNTVGIGLMAIGETFVLLTGGIDLSVGAVLALSGVITALLLQAHLPWYVGALVGVLSGSAAGFFNGIVIRYTRVPPFIATLACMGVASSIPLIITHANSIPILTKGFASLGQGFIFHYIPIPVIIFLLVALVTHIILWKTVFGVHVYALGGNRESARLSGVNTSRIEVIVYVISGTLAGLSGVILASRLASGYPTAGTGNSLFQAISGAVVGGVSLFGGVGAILGAVVGAMIIGTLSDGMNILNINSYWQPLVIGLVILIAVSADTLRSAQGGRLAGWLLRCRIFRGK